MAKFEVEEITPTTKKAGGQRFEVQEITSESKEVAPKSKKAERPSDPGKHYLAGLANLSTDIPIILGMGGAGLEAGLGTLLGDEPIGKKSFLKNWQKAASEGIDAKLTDLGLSGRKSVLGAFGLEEPRSTEDLAAELGALVTPVPGFRVLAGVKGLGVGARALRAASTAANLLTPMVKYGPKGHRLDKGFAIRAGTQAGVGVGADQTLRALMDTPFAPTLFSEEALAGELPPLETQTKAPHSNLVKSKTPGKFEVTEITAETDVTDVEMQQGLLDDTPDGYELRRELDGKLEKNNDAVNTNMWLVVAAVIGTGTVAARVAQKKGLLPTKITTKDAVKAAEKVHADHVDKAAHLGDALIETGATKEQAGKVVSNAHTDPVGMADEFNRTGTLTEDFATTRPMFSPNDLENRAIALGKENEKLFNDAMEAATILASRRNARGAGELFRNARPDNEYEAILARAKEVEGMDQLMKDTFSTFDGLLDFRLSKKVIGEEQVKAWRGKFASGKFTDGVADINYMALYTKNEEAMWRRMSRYFLGINTTAGKKAEINREFMARGGDAGGNTIGAIQSLKRYAANSISDAIEQSFKGKVLLDLAGTVWRGAGKALRYSPTDGNSALSRFIRGADGKKQIVKGADIKFAGRETLLLGRATKFDKPDSIPIEYIDDPRVVGGRTIGKKFEGETLSDLRVKYGDEIQTAFVDGEMLIFHVPDIGLQAALNLSPRLSANLQFWSHWRGVMTKGTTGHFSPFAPFSHMFSAQQVAVNTAAREGLWEGIKSPFRSLEGTRQLMVANAANDLSELLAKRLATRTGIGRLAPDIVLSLHKTLKNRYERTMISRFRAETGKTITGMGQHNTYTTVDDIIRQYGDDFSTFFGPREMGTVWKLWKTWNNAWHEGPAYASMLRYIDKNVAAGVPIKPQQIRDAVDYGKILAGDMTRKGSSKVAAAVNASVPFGTATIQSWNSLTSAARKHPGRFLTGASALIGVPTMSEMVWNSVISEGSQKLWDDPHNPNKKWSYNDYYYNGFTSQQRVANFIYMVPGRPPWEAIIIPVSPEWSLFRGAVMDGFDSIFNFSEVGDLATANNGKSKIGREHLIASAARVADIPLPPVLAGLATWAGADVRLGLAYEYDTSDPDDPGKQMQLIRRVPLGRGERISPKMGQTRHVNGLLDIDTTAIMQDVFGAAGGLVAMGLEGWHGRATDEGASFIDGIEGFTDAVGLGLYSQARILNPIFGKALSPNVNSDEISTNLFAKKKGLDHLAKQQDLYFTGGMIHIDGSPVRGDTLAKMMSDDVITYELSGDAKTLKTRLGDLDKEINVLLRDIRTMTHATNLGKASVKRDKIDSTKLQILAKRAQQLQSLISYEEHASGVLSKRYKRDIHVDLSTHKSRPNLPTSSIGQELRK